MRRITMLDNCLIEVRQLRFMWGNVLFGSKLTIDSNTSGQTYTTDGTTRRSRTYIVRLDSPEQGCSIHRPEKEMQHLITKHSYSQWLTHTMILVRELVDADNATVSISGIAYCSVTVCYRVSNLIHWVLESLGLLRHSAFTGGVDRGCFTRRKKLIGCTRGNACWITLRCWMCDLN